MPATWERTLQPSELGTTDAMFFISPAADPAHWEDGPGADVLSVTVMPGVTLPEAIDMWRYLLGAGGVVDPIAQQARSLGGQPADENVFEGAVNGAERRVRVACTSVGGALYLVMHGAAPDRYEPQEARVSAALDSFELLPGSAFAPPVLVDPYGDAAREQLIEREREAAHAESDAQLPPEQPHAGIADRLASLFHGRRR